MTAQPWQRIGEQSTRYEGHLRVVRRRLRMPGGRESDWDLLESPDSVVVLPLTPDGQVVCIRQYRPGPDRVVTCLPGGLIDPGERVLDAAARELREETGWTSPRWDVAGSTQWFKSTETSWAVVAHDCVATGGQALEDDEDIEVVVLGLDVVRDSLRAGTFATVPHAYLALDHAGLL